MNIVLPAESHRFGLAGTCHFQPAMIKVRARTLFIGDEDSYRSGGAEGAEKFLAFADGFFGLHAPGDVLIKNEEFLRPALRLDGNDVDLDVEEFAVLGLAPGDLVDGILRRQHRKVSTQLRNLFRGYGEGS